jgi:hypothetical protein
MSRILSDKMLLIVSSNRIPEGHISILQRVLGDERPRFYGYTMRFSAGQEIQ